MARLGFHVRALAPASALRSLTLTLIVLAACAGALCARAGEAPQAPCHLSFGGGDNSSLYCDVGATVEVYGGGDCKPEVIGSAWAVRHAEIPEGCCTGSLDQQTFSFGLRAVNRLLSGMRVQAADVPWVAYVKFQLAGNATAGALVSLGGVGGYTGIIDANSPSFRDTIRGVIPAAAFATAPQDAAGALSISGSAMLQVSVSAGVCNTDPNGTGRTSQALADPFIEIDPDSPLASQWVVQKETAPGSGIWVEMKRDSASVQFTPVATVGSADSSNITGIAWGDYDGDGDLDLYVANQSGAGNRLYRNDGGTLVDVTPPAMAMASVWNMDCAWADLDNDGRLDLLLVRGGGLHNVLFRNLGGGAFAVDTSTVLSTHSVVDPRGIAFADYDNDGRLDVLIAGCSGDGRLFHNEGGGVFTDVTGSGVLNTRCAQAGLWGDYDNDGDMDLFMLDRGGVGPGLFRNDHGTLVDVTDASKLPVWLFNDAYSGAWVDYDDDGWLDLFVTTDAGNRLFRNLGDGTFADSTDAWTGYAGHGTGVAWGDYTLDGNLDAYLCRTDGPNRVAVRYDGHFGNELFDIGGVDDPGSGGHSVGWADVDGDGDLDLFVGYANGGTLLRNDQALGHHWLAVDLHGITSNRFGVGAAIRVVAGGKAHHRQVLSNTGYWSGNPLRQTFGLRDAATVDTLVVTWPSGTVTTLAGPIAADRRVTLFEDGRVTGVAPGATEPRLRLLGPGPNPFARAATIRFELPRPMPVSLTIYDVAGRRVRELRSAGLLPAGVGELTWDGRGNDGSVQRPGVYLCRMRAGDVASASHLVLRLTKLE